MHKSDLCILKFVLVYGTRRVGPYYNIILRVNTGAMCLCYYMCVRSYSAHAVEQRHMANSGVQRTKDWNLRTEVDWYSALIRVFEYRVSYLLSTYHIQALSVVPVNCSIGINTPGGAVASGSSLVLPRAAAATVTRGQYSIARHTRALPGTCMQEPEPV
jgi:hypothetical protein